MKLFGLALRSTLGLLIATALYGCGPDTIVNSQPTPAVIEVAVPGGKETTEPLPVEEPQPTTRIVVPTRVAVPLDASTIRIVSSLPRTGLSKDQTDDIVAAFEMALDERNNRAGQFNIVYEDWDDSTVETGRWDAATEGVNATDAASDPDVMVYLGTFNSGAAAIAIPILNKAGLAMISPSNTAPELTKQGFDDSIYNQLYTNGPKNYFRVTIADDVQGKGGANWATELGYAKAFVVDDDEVYGKSVASVFEQQFRANGGTVVGRVSLDPRQASFPSLAERIRDSGADVLYFGGLVDSGGPQLLKDLRQVSSTIAFMGPDGVLTQVFIDAVYDEDATRGALATVGSKEAGDFGPKADAFFDKFKAKHNRDIKGDSYSHYLSFALYGYEAMNVALDAIERAGVKNRAAILKAIRETKDYDGALGKWSFDENGDVTRDDIGCYAVVDGRWELQKYVKANK